MFGRRRRAASNPPLTTSRVDPSAATAAISAFQHHSGNASLSSAAASAALRSRPTTPTSVADVQTKRTLRRNGSTSSAGSSVADGTRSPGLERRGSNSSMSSRTFRDQSPARYPRASMEPVPPVPAIPKNAASLKANGNGSVSQRRAASVDVVGRVMSPGPAQRPGFERRGSVNFSYPTNIIRSMSAMDQRPLTSPSPQDTEAAPQKLIYDPNTRTMVPAVELLAIEQRLRDAATKPVKRKKKKMPGPGSHFAEGTSGDRTRGTALDAINASIASQQPATTNAKIESPSEKQTVADSTQKKPERTPIRESSSDRGSIGDFSDNDDRIPHSQRRKKRATPSKKPSFIQEESEDEGPKDDHLVFIDRQVALRKLDPDSFVSDSDSPPAQQTGTPATALGHGQVQGPENDVQPQREPSPKGQPLATAPEAHLSINQHVGKAPPQRVPSVSPSRSAHFAPSPETPGNLAVRHSPPTRSISPRKSALKHSPSPRTQSPVAGLPREGSDASPSAEDRAIARKKSVRVSFDDESTVVVGTAAPPVTTDSPYIESPQAKRSWLSKIGKKRETSSSPDNDEVMTPRPVLPSFGSVREKRHRDIEERPLVRPSDIGHHEPSNKSTEDRSEGASKDYAIGAIIAQDFATKEEPKVLNGNEPLPPEVTSKEGGEYWSDSESSVDESIKGADEETSLSQSTSIKSIPEDVKNERPQPIKTETGLLTPASSNGNVPQIAVTKATPTIEESEETREWFSIPGGWVQSTDSDIDSHDAEEQLIHAVEPPIEPVSVITKTVPVDVHTPVTVIPESERTESSDNDSVYSDAAEDPSELGGGFQSLDAVLESPLRTTAPPLAIQIPTQPSIQPSTDPLESIKEPAASDEPGSTDSWEKAQEYWKSLTTEQKAEMERAAQRKIEEDSAKPKPLPQSKNIKPPKSALKKSTYTPPPQPVDNSRTYMIAPGSKGAGVNYNINEGSTMRSRPTKQTSLRAGSSNKSADAKGDGQRSAKTMRQPQSSQVAGIVIDPAQVEMLVKKINAQSNAAAAKPAPKIPPKAPNRTSAPPLRRKGSGDSDSSFKRARPASNGFAMRRSMRESAQPTPARTYSPDRSSRFSLRSLSPGRSPTRGTTSFGGFNQTMRGSRSKSHDTPTLRSPSNSGGKGSLRLSGMSRSKPAPKAKKSSSKFSSRFADSSDEEDARPSFRSRFADSSDEEDSPLPRRTRPVAPYIPPTHVEDEESSDLPDSDDDEPVSVVKTRTAPSNIVTNGVTTTNGPMALDSEEHPKSGELKRSGSGRATLASPTPGATPATRKRRGSILGGILSRKKADPSSKVRKAEVESAARRDTPLERSRSDLMIVKRMDSDRSAMAQSPKLQKKNPFLQQQDIKPRDGEDWPLPASPIDTNQNGRPSTSHATSGSGAAGAKRMDLGERRSSAPLLSSMQNEALKNNVVMVEGGKKKKKFQTLRKMFKLDD